VDIAIKDKFVQYSVKDEGIGIPEDQRGHIFEKFFRADNALRFVPEGSGLGLSLAKSLVEGWGGKIWFETEVNKGTTFFFTLPVEGMAAKEGEVKISV
jgi:signal transduction histidine kinase